MPNNLLLIPPRNLFLKELRQLQPLSFALFAVQGLFYMISFLVATFSNSLSLRQTGIPMIGYLVSFCAVSALAGSLFFSTEKSTGTDALLLRMPIARVRIFWAKALGGISVLILFVLGSALLFILVQAIWSPLQSILNPARAGDLIVVNESFHGWLDLALVALFGYLICAYLSLFNRNPILPLILGLCLTLVFWQAGEFVEGIYRLFFDVFGLWMNNIEAQSYTRLTDVLTKITQTGLLMATAFACWHRLEYLEEKAAPPQAMGVSSTLSTRLFRLSSATSLLRVEGRQKRLAVWVISAITALVEIFTFYAGTPVPALLPWAFLTGCIVGGMLLTQPERSTVSFFLYHLPISRSVLFWHRLATGLALGAFFFIGVPALILLVSTIMTRYWLVVPLDLLSGPVIYEGMLYAFSTYCLAYFTGCVFSLLQGNEILGFLDIVIALAVPAAATHLMWARGVYPPWIIPILYPGFPLALFILCLAWWTITRNRCAEPDARKDIWILLLIGAIWGTSILLNLIDPFDLLYLMGIDLYRFL